METKSKVTLTIDSEVVQQIKNKNLNMSGLCENALREIIYTFERDQDPTTCKHQFTWPFSVPTGLAKECKKCGLIKRVYMESFEETMHKASKQKTI